MSFNLGIKIHLTWIYKIPDFRLVQTFINWGLNINFVFMNLIICIRFASAIWSALITRKMYEIYR